MLRMYLLCWEAGAKGDPPAANHNRLRSCNAAVGLCLSSLRTGSILEGEGDTLCTRGRVEKEQVPRWWWTSLAQKGALFARLNS